MARRGATENSLSERFGDPSRSDDGEWMDHVIADEGALPPLRTMVTVEHPKTVLTRNDSPDIPFDRSFNAYRGCEHGCIYCFARPTHAYHNLSPGLDFETRLFAKPDGPALLRKAFAQPGYRPEVLAMGTNTDPYQPIEAQWRITRGVLELCHETRHPVAITTKSDRLLRDIDLLAELAGQGLLRVMLSITTLDPWLAMRMEPRAATPRRRLLAVEKLAAVGVDVVVSASPMVPAINDSEVESIAAAAAAAGAKRLVWIPIRLPHEVAPLFEQWLEAHFPDRRQKVIEQIRGMRGGRMNDPRFGDRMRPQGEWGRLMTQRFEMAIRRAGLDRSLPPLSTHLFRKPPPDSRQGELF